MNERPFINEPISSPQAEYDSLRYVSAETPCPYLDARMFRAESYSTDHLDGALYERLLARGFRRSGRVLYRPRCRGCQECRQLRVLVERFTPTRSMRRVIRRNADVRVESGDPKASREKLALYQRYLDTQHDSAMSRDYEAFVDFLYDSPMESREFCYHLGERLVGVSIADRCRHGYSSVYMYFDPDLADRSLGTFSAIWEIENCRREGLAYYYLGYYVAGSQTMSYKARFRPNQVLAGDDHWVSLQT